MVPFNLDYCEPCVSTRAALKEKGIVKFFFSKIVKLIQTPKMPSKPP